MLLVWLRKKSVEKVWKVGFLLPFQWLFRGRKQKPAERNYE
uniref:Uncharacterized protein n=1 Tax=Rhizophora mucronata TaxID=61149 RepID=A0A2P2JIZ0_RHIMU